MVKAKSQYTKTRKAYVAYYRVSTGKQEKSGLGLDAQRSAVLDFINGGAANLIAEFTETESGKRNDRPQLAKALKLCRKEKAILIIAKLDRLARNVHFISGLMESRVDFQAVDLPDANRLTVHILAAVAENEREAISQRTRAALAEAKARGVKLGNPRKRSTKDKNGKLIIGRDEAGETGRQRLRDKADRFAANVVPIIREIEASGVTSNLGIAKALNARGIPTARGGEWYDSTVKNALARNL